MLGGGKVGGKSRGWSFPKHIRGGVREKQWRNFKCWALLTGERVGWGGVGVCQRI